MKVQLSQQPTNGVTYVRMVNSLPTFTPDLLPLLPLFCNIVTRLVSLKAPCVIFLAEFALVKISLFGYFSFSFATSLLTELSEFLTSVFIYWFYSSLYLLLTIVFWKLMAFTSSHGSCSENISPVLIENYGLSLWCLIVNLQSGLSVLWFYDLVLIL